MIIGITSKEIPAKTLNSAIFGKVTGKAMSKDYRLYQESAMKQIYRDILFLSLIPFTFIALLFEAKLQISPLEHKLIQMLFIIFIYTLVAVWMNYDVKIKEREMREVLTRKKEKRTTNLRNYKKIFQSLFHPNQ